MTKHSVKSAASIVKNNSSRMSKRLAFRAAIDSGHNITQASVVAGVTRQTGSNWKAEMEKGSFIYGDSASSILTKDKSVEILSQIAICETESGAYRIKAIDLCAELQGTKAPARSVVETRIYPTDVIAWLDGIDTSVNPQKRIGESTETPMLPSAQPDPVPRGIPKDGVIGDVSTPQKISTKSEQADHESPVTVDAIEVSEESDKEGE